MKFLIGWLYHQGLSGDTHSPCSWWELAFWWAFVWWLLYSSGERIWRVSDASGSTSGRYRSGPSGMAPIHRAPLWWSGGYLVPQDTRGLCLRHCDDMLYDGVADGKPYCITAKALKRWATKVAFSLGIEHGGGLRIIPSLKLGRAGRWLAFSHSHAFRDGYAPDGATIIQNLLKSDSRLFVGWNG